MANDPGLFSRVFGGLNVKLMGAAKKLHLIKEGAVLKFDVAIVRRLADHARRCDEFGPYYGGTRAEAALWLVGDHGVYLMSNGRPPIDENGNQWVEGAGVPMMSAPALGCDPNVDPFETWWPVHGAIAGGDDFVTMIPLEDIDRVLPFCKSKIVVFANARTHRVASDAGFRSA